MENIIKTLRTKAGWSQTKLAEELGWSQADVSRHEKDETELTISKIAKLSRVFGVPQSVFVAGTGEAEADKKGIILQIAARAIAENAVPLGTHEKTRAFVMARVVEKIAAASGENPEAEFAAILAAAGVSLATIVNVKMEHHRTREAVMRKIGRALESAGVEFTEMDGVRRRPQDIEVFVGLDRFEELYDFMYRHLESHGGEVCLSTVNEKLFKKHRKDFDAHCATRQSYPMPDFNHRHSKKQDCCAGLYILCIALIYK